MTTAPFSLPFKRDERFTGRAYELEQIHAALQRNNVVVLRSPLADAGLDTGKAALAIEYAYRYRDAYRAVHGVVPQPESRRRWREDDWHERRSTNLQPRAAPVTASLTVHIADAGYRISGASSGGPEGGKRLITTNKHDTQCPHVVVEVGPLGRRDPLAILGPLADRDPAGAKALVEATRGIPLALRLTAESLRDSRDRRIRDVLSFFSPGDSRGPNAAAIEGAFRFAWETLQDNEARRILHFVSLLPPYTAVSMSQIVTLLGDSPDADETLAQGVALALRRKLLEERADGTVSQNPWIAEAVRAMSANLDAFATECYERLLARIGNFDWLEDEVATLGIDSILDVLDMADLMPGESQIERNYKAARSPILELLRRLARPLGETTHRRAIFLQQIAAWDTSAGREHQYFTGLGEQAQKRLEERNESTFRVAVAASNDNRDWSTVAFCADGCHLISATWDGYVGIWDVARAEMIEERAFNVRFHSKPAIAPAGLILAARTERGIELFDIADGVSLGIVGQQGHHNAALSLSADGRYLATLHVGSREDVVLSHYDLRNATPPRQTQVAHGRFSSVDRFESDSDGRVIITNDGKRILAPTEKGGIFMWDLLSDRSKELNVALRPGQESQHISNGTKRIMLMSGDGRHVFLTRLAQLIVWEIDGPVGGSLLWDQINWERSFAVGRDGRFVFSADAAFLSIHERASGQLKASLPIDGGYGSSHRPPAIAVSPDNKTIFVHGTKTLFLTWLRRDDGLTLR